MVYQHSNSINKIISSSKKQKFNRDDSWAIKTWWKKYVDVTRISLSNKYFVSLSITYYQAFFPFVWFYFGLVAIPWGILFILSAPFLFLRNLFFRKYTSSSFRV